MFLADANWQLKLSRIKKFIEDTKIIYSQTKIDNQNLKKPLEKLLDSKIAKNQADDFLYYYVRFHNLAGKIASSRPRADSQ